MNRTFLFPEILLLAVTQRVRRQLPLRLLDFKLLGSLCRWDYGDEKVMDWGQVSTAMHHSFLPLLSNFCMFVF